MSGVRKQLLTKEDRFISTKRSGDESSAQKIDEESNFQTFQLKGKGWKDVRSKKRKKNSSDNSESKYF